MSTHIDSPPARPTQRIKGIWLKHRVSVNDLGMLGIICLVMLYIAFEFDIFINEGTVTAAEQTIELDEALLIGGVLLAGLLVFSVRRYREQKREVDRRRQAERVARELAYQDPLTGLPNRRQFEEALRMAAASPPMGGGVHAVFMMDMNGFKQINDVYGHDAGDAVLIVIAQRLSGTLGTDALVARLGGDEFVIVAQHLLGPEAAANIALRVLQSLSEPIVVDTVRHDVSAGIGISLLPTDSTTAEEALRQADVALYRAKAERRSSLRFFEQEMDLLIQERGHLEQRLRHAIELGQIQPLFRPVLDLKSNRVVGFEAVAHLIAPESESISPERFLPIAEETGLIHALAHELLVAACIAALQWPDDVMLAINVLPGQLKDRHLAHGILQTLACTGLPPHRLQLDIPESMIVQDLPAAKALLGPLKEAGASIALDHFGTGYSTLYHMQEFKFDKVKIDRRLIEHMDSESGSDARLVRALIGLGQGLGMTVSAEGIADQENSSRLLDSGVDEGQTTASLLDTQAARNLVRTIDEQRAHTAPGSAPPA